MFGGGRGRVLHLRRVIRRVEVCGVSMAAVEANKKKKKKKKKKICEETRHLKKKKNSKK
eukprot:NODE_28797_length_466_cov_1.100295.p3 GENE.NODE_28797_length_466_cov_1.100295~~NODE_28797_length_466_cov_1.100295.p3  ORF type:complete len:59 (-),score=34.03 NODE_28797_length_466_cov_1.100295:67-243(-)